METEFGAPLQGASRRAWEAFLSRCGLAAEPDADCTVLLREAGEIIAAGSRKGNLLECIAVDATRRGEDLTAAVLTHLRRDALAHGVRPLLLCTKPENGPLFEALFFYPVAATGDVLLMESERHGVRDFVAALAAQTPGGAVGATIKPGGAVGAAPEPGAVGATPEPGAVGVASEPGTVGAASEPGTVGAAQTPGAVGATPEPGTVDATPEPGCMVGAASEPGTVGAAQTPGMVGATQTPGAVDATPEPGAVGAAQIPVAVGAASEPVAVGAASEPGGTVGAALTPGAVGAASESGAVGAAVMNCNPFTLGHRHLIETAARDCGRLYVFVLSEDRSLFSAADRLSLVRQGTADLPNVLVCPTGPYLLSAATFPTYFLPDRERAAEVRCALDLRVFTDCFAPPLRITRRYVGTEPFSPLTAAYNRALWAALPPRGIEVTELPRLEGPDGPISASAVRALLHQNQPEALRRLVPETTFRYLEQRGLI